MFLHQLSLVLSWLVLSCHLNSVGFRLVVLKFALQLYVLFVQLFSVFTLLLYHILDLLFRCLRMACPVHAVSIGLDGSLVNEGSAHQ